MAEGYVYFDLFNQNVGGKPVRLISPTIKAVQEQYLCFTFWFAVFGAGESAQLRVVRHDNSSSDNGEPSPQEKAKLELSLQLYNNNNNNLLLFSLFHVNVNKATAGSAMHGKDDSIQVFLRPSSFCLLLHSPLALTGIYIPDQTITNNFGYYY